MEGRRVTSKLWNITLEYNESGPDGQGTEEYTEVDAIGQGETREQAMADTLLRYIPPVGYHIVGVYCQGELTDASVVRTGMH